MIFFKQNKSVFIFHYQNKTWSAVVLSQKKLKIHFSHTKTTTNLNSHTKTTTNLNSHTKTTTNLNSHTKTTTNLNSHTKTTTNFNSHTTIHSTYIQQQPTYKTTTRLSYSESIYIQNNKTPITITTFLHNLITAQFMNI